MTQTATYNKPNSSKQSLHTRMKELIYQGRNQEFFELFAEVDLDRMSPAQVRDLHLLKASLLFEMHKVPEATEVIRSLILARPDGWNDHEIMLTVARIAYLEQDFDKAFDLFEVIIEHTELRDMRIRALIGSANAHMAKGRVHAAAKVIQELELLEPFTELDQRLALIHLQATRALMIDKDPLMAQRMFAMGLKLASERGWNYFILRFLFGSAKVEQQYGKPETLNCYLSLIRDLVSLQQSGYFCFLYNQTFKDQDRLIYSFVEIDTVYRRVMVGNKWVDLTSQPEVFNLLRFLRNEDRFVGIKEIVSYLYPNQTFSNEIHVPMVAELVEAAREHIEPYAKQPRVLLAHDHSFRLLAS